MNAIRATIRIAVRHRQSDRHLIRLIRIVVLPPSLASAIFQMGRELRGAPTARRSSLFRTAARAFFHRECDPIHGQEGARSLDIGSVS
jgi:hypothetical protein